MRSTLKGVTILEDHSTHQSDLQAHHLVFRRRIFATKLCDQLPIDVSPGNSTSDEGLGPYIVHYLSTLEFMLSGITVEAGSGLLVVFIGFLKDLDRYALLCQEQGEQQS